MGFNPVLPPSAASLYPATPNPGGPMTPAYSPATPASEGSGIRPQLQYVFCCYSLPCHLVCLLSLRFFFVFFCIYNFFCIFCDLQCVVCHYSLSFVTHQHNFCHLVCLCHLQFISSLNSISFVASVSMSLTLSFVT